MSLWQVLGAVSALLGIFVFLLMVGVRVKQMGDILGIPQLNFFFLFFWSVVAALVGGLFWNSLCKLNEYHHFMQNCGFVGGTGSEPHGIGAIIWPIATNAPIVIILISLNLKYQFMEIRNQLSLYLVFLLGAVVGSFIFYDLPISGNSGFRQHFDARNVPFLEKELLLVIIWSSLISIFGFLSTAIINIGIYHEHINYDLILWQIAISVGLTTLAVVFFLLVFPGDPKFDTARGIIAGLFLRIALFFALFIGSNTR